MGSGSAPGFGSSGRKSSGFGKRKSKRSTANGGKWKRFGNKTLRAFNGGGGMGGGPGADGGADWGGFDWGGFDASPDASPGADGGTADGGWGAPEGMFDMPSDQSGPSFSPSFNAGQAQNAAEVSGYGGVDPWGGATGTMSDMDVAAAAFDWGISKGLSFQANRNQALAAVKDNNPELSDKDARTVAFHAGKSLTSGKIDMGALGKWDSNWAPSMFSPYPGLTSIGTFMADKAFMAGLSVEDPSTVDSPAGTVSVGPGVGGPGEGSKWGTGTTTRKMPDGTTQTGYYDPGGNWHVKEDPMGKGSGGSQSTMVPGGQSVSTTTLPAYAEPFYKRLMERTEAETNQPYQQYTGQRIAGLSQDTQDAFGQVRGMRDPYQLGIGSARAQQGTQFKAGPVSSDYRAQPISSDFQATGYQGGQFDSAAAQQYMNPYVENVMNRLQNRAFEQFRQQKGQRDAQAIQAGAFGGSRQAIAEEQARSGMLSQLADTEAQQLSQAFQQAQGQYTSDQARRLQAEAMGEGSRQFGAQQGLTAQQATEQAFQEQAKLGIGAATATEEARARAEQLGLGAAGQLGEFGKMQQELGLQRADALSKIGMTQEQLEQQKLQQRYTDFINQRDYERQQLGFYSGILQGMPVTPQSNVMNYEPAPNPLNQALGMGVGAAGIYKAFNSSD
jgi:hypothetical protein